MPTHVGGNIGKSLLEELPNIEPEHAVVLELSSFQLENVPIVGVSPGVAIVTNLLPHHLDRHVTIENYGDAKKNIFRYQDAGGVLILNRDCPVTSAWAAEARGKVEFFRSTPAGFANAESFELCVPGTHNQANAQAAWIAARQFGVPRAKAAEALRKFPGLEHRLQFVIERDGVRYFNDSKCTTPEGGVVALGAFEPRRCVIIVGGYDKHVGFDVFGKILAERAKAVVGIGQTRGRIREAMERFRTGDVPPFSEAADLAEALKAARKYAAPGDVILLSPACASYDMFHNYERRGELFVKLATEGK
jgi:UDP-N-acetylmuramoylalanine--D-glutamate ligase